LTPGVVAGNAQHWETCDLAGADVRVTRFCDAKAAHHWFERLHTEIPWGRHQMRLFGRQIDAPRLSCWIGDPGTTYTYSGTRFEPEAWTPGLSELREWLFTHCGECYNSVLCNLYRDGKDSMGWHSDSEPELGAEPVIASLSFGGARKFYLRHRHNPHQRLLLELPSGSLLVMAGATQRNYRHALPKTVRKVDPRINLTFRSIRPAPWA
jgi:alkylated DNA repair dioxygenase AlkB